MPFAIKDGWTVFKGPLLARLDRREDYGEDRWQGIRVFDGRVVAVVFTEREPDIVRLISLRKADKDETREFEAAIGD